MSYRVDLLDRNIAIAEGRSAEALRILCECIGGDAKTVYTDLTMENLRDCLAQFDLECEAYAKWDGRLELSSYEGYWDHFPDDVFEKLTPVIEDGGVAVFRSEENDIWRYVYNNGEFEVQHIDLLGAEGWH